MTIKPKKRSNMLWKRRNFPFKMWSDDKLDYDIEDEDEVEMRNA